MGRKKLLEDADLLAVARDVFVEAGFGASTREIARRAGVSEAVLFQRFRTKPELFFAAMVPPAPDIHAIIVSQLARRDPAARLEDIGLRMVAYLRDVTPILLPLVSHPDFDYDTFVERHPETPLNQLVIGLQGWFAWLEERGVLLSGRANAMALTMVSAMTGIALFERIGVHGGEVDERLVREIASVVWRGGEQIRRDWPTTGLPRGD